MPKKRVGLKRRKTQAELLDEALASGKGLEAALTASHKKIKEEVKEAKKKRERSLLSKVNLKLKEIYYGGKAAEKGVYKKRRKKK